MLERLVGNHRRWPRISAFIRGLLDDADVATAQTTLSLVPDTNVPSQASFTAQVARANYTQSLFLG